MTMKITQNVEFISNLVKQASNGGMAPAAFQRPYAWSQSDVLALLNSVLRGYPIGSFLLWNIARATEAPPYKARLGPLPIKAGNRPEQLLLDGQNRLASFAWAMRDVAEPLPQDLSEHEARVWTDGLVVAVDLENKSFEFASRAEIQTLFKFPARILFDNSYANQLLRERWATQWDTVDADRVNAALKWHDMAQAQFMSAKAVVTVLENATLDKAKDAFLHICKAGVPMSADDFEAAIRWQTAD